MIMLQINHSLLFWQLINKCSLNFKHFGLIWKKDNNNNNNNNNKNNLGWSREYSPNFAGAKKSCFFSFLEFEN